MTCGNWTCRQEAWQPEGPLIKYVHFVDEETGGHRGPAAKLSGTGTFVLLLQSRMGSTTMHLTLPDWFAAGSACSEEGALPLSLDVRKTLGMSEDLGSLGWGSEIRRIKGRVWQPLVPNPTVPTC